MTDTDRPLVTFALFAYNQEKYIREAVEGAFSQTYEPLEIILSDDCSSDRTFEIMQEMAAAYEGPHKVRVRQSKVNLGVIDHVISVAKMATGELLIVAAGDDISKAHRCNIVVDYWMSENSTALYSAFDECDDDGVLMRSGALPEPLDRIQNLFEGCKVAVRHQNKVRNVPGYSAAYRRTLFADLPFTGTRVHNEDALSTYLINLRGELISAIPESLMVRRISTTSISAKAIFSDAYEVNLNEMTIQRFAKSTLKFHTYLYGLEYLFDSCDFKLVTSRLYRSRGYLHIVSTFWDSTFVSKVRLLMNARSKDEVYYILPRILGLKVFCLLKLSLAKK